jgi:hypothetical protein
MPQLQGLAKSLCLFEKPMKKLFPSNRIIDNRYIESNLDGPYANPELKRVFRHVRTESWNPVFSHLESADDTDSFVQAVSNTTKWVAWNFTCLNDLGTVESRRPPGVSSAAEATKWAGFTLAFVSAAITDTSYFNYYRSLCIHPSVEELYGFASNGLALINTGNNTPVDLEWMRAFA